MGSGCDRGVHDGDLYVSFLPHPLQSEVRAHVRKGPQLKVRDPQGMVRPVLRGAQISVQEKHDLWDALAGNAPKSTQASKVDAVGLNEVVGEVVLELLLAGSRAALLIGC